MTRFLSLLLLSVLLSPAPVATSEPERAQARLQRHWKLSDSETLWTVRYSNCDYGFYVELAPGVVAHGPLPPSPNHGFVVPLPEVGKKSFALDANERVIWVEVAYDLSGDQPIEGTSRPAKSNAKADSKTSDKASGTAVQAARPNVTLAGMPAVLTRSSHPSAFGDEIEETIVAKRDGIVYTLSLQTFQKYQAADEMQFHRISNGFRLTQLPKGECSNG